MSNIPLISVIVPVFNTEKFLNKCLNSILQQTYRNLQIICVDDASPDHCSKILENFSAQDDRITIVKHDENKGLFAARISGIKAAKGEYVCFIDSDDHVSGDWIRPMLKKAQETEADITIGQWANDYEDGAKTYYNLDPLRLPLRFDEGKGFLEFVKQSGSCFSWHVVWNKLYKTSLFTSQLDKLESFSKSHPHFIMCEDIVYSFAVWSQAQTIVNVTEQECSGLYFYYRHKAASTHLINKDTKIIKNNVLQVKAALDFANEIIVSRGLCNVLQAPFYKWTLSLAKCYYNLFEKKHQFAVFLKNLFSLNDISELYETNQVDDYYYSIDTILDSEKYNSMERIKLSIVDPTIDVISFDIFDTLILRPFFRPTDLFYMLGNDFNETMSIKSYTEFAALRTQAERRCRAAKSTLSPNVEEITLDEIYNQMHSDYGFPTEKLDSIKQKELEKEIKYCYARKTGKYLYDLAIDSGKKVIFTSDMYLPESFVREILTANGYTTGELFLSSTHMVCKSTKNLYKYIRKCFNLSPKKFLHIGDNWESDVKNAIACGWNALHLPKTTDQFAPTLQKILTNAGKPVDMNNTFYNGFVSIRCMYALIANKLYDNPFIQHSDNSDYDANAFQIGYAALGPYLYSITDWILKNAKEKKKNCIQYVARDGYLPMIAHTIFEKYYDELPQKNYLYISRKALLLTDIYTLEDLYSVQNKLSIYTHSPQKIVRMFLPYLKCSETIIKEKLHMTDAMYLKNFCGVDDFTKTIYLIGDFIDFSKLDEYRDHLRTYFNSLLSPRSILFDLGYSGRAESSLTKLLEYPFDSLYIHTNSQIANDRMRVDHFDIQCFYDYKPKITGVVREHAFMKLAPSTIGYTMENGECKPIFEDIEINNATILMTNSLQTGALNFVEDYLRIFYDSIDLPFRHQDFAFPFEQYLHYSQLTDRRIFSCVTFEDDFGLGNEINAFDFWNREIYNSSTQTGLDSTMDPNLLPIAKKFMKMPRIKKALFYLFFEPKTFYRKLKKYILSKKTS